MFYAADAAWPVLRLYPRLLWLDSRDLRGLMPSERQKLIPDEPT
jgi:hypothetical protein